MRMHHATAKQVWITAPNKFIRNRMKREIVLKLAFVLELMGVTSINDNMRSNIKTCKRGHVTVNTGASVGPANELVFVFI